MYNFHLRQVKIKPDRENHLLQMKNNQQFINLIDEMKEQEHVTQIEGPFSAWTTRLELRAHIGRMLKI
jgi:hypothetical protein